MRSCFWSRCCCPWTPSSWLSRLKNPRPSPFLLPFPCPPPPPPSPPCFPSAPPFPPPSPLPRCSSSCLALCRSLSCYHVLCLSSSSKRRCCQHRCCYRGPSSSSSYHGPGLCPSYPCPSHHRCLSYSCSSSSAWLWLQGCCPALLLSSDGHLSCPCLCPSSALGLSP